MQLKPNPILVDQMLSTLITGDPWTFKVGKEVIYNDSVYVENGKLKSIRYLGRISIKIKSKHLKGKTGWFCGSKEIATLDLEKDLFLFVGDILNVEFVDGRIILEVS